jgi:diacylglycerol O-acyltransferase
MPPPWAPKARPPRPHGDGGLDLAGLAREVLGKTSEVAGLVPVLSRTVRSSLNKQTTSMSFAAPRSILNTRITGARRFAAQSWPLDRIKGVARRTDHTLNDVVLAMCAGALRAYLFELGELPDEPMIAMVPVSLHGNASSSRDPEGNSIGEVMCNLGTDQVEAADRLAVISASMTEGKRMLGTMTPMQVIAMSGLGLAPLLLQPALGLVGHARPPFNLTISNVPGPRRPMYWNGARLDGLYPLSIPLDGQALNITCTSYAGEIGFGLIGCRRCVPHLQRLLVHLEDALQDLEKVAA